MARPSKFLKVAEQIIDGVRAGAHPTVAARAAGIPERTFHGWMNDPRPRFGDFRRRIDEAEALAEIEAVGQIRKTDPKWLLERRHRERWGRADAATPPGLAPTPSSGPKPLDRYQETFLLSREELWIAVLRLRARGRGEPWDPANVSPVPASFLPSGEPEAVLDQEQMRAASWLLLERRRVQRGLPSTEEEDQDRLRTLVELSEP